MAERDKLTIERVPLDSLTPHPRNVRQGNIPNIMKSLKAHSQYAPIVVQRSSNHVIKGNHTWRAAKKLRWSNIDAIFLDVDDAEALRIMLQDNQSSDDASNDIVALAALLRELGVEGTGYTQEDLESYEWLSKSLQGSTDAMSEWNGMPDFEQGSRQSVAAVTIHFPTEEDCDTFFKLIGRDRRASIWWPEGDGMVGSSRVKDEYVSGP